MCRLTLLEPGVRGMHCEALPCERFPEHRLLVRSRAAERAHPLLQLVPVDNQCSERREGSRKGRIYGTTLRTNNQEENR